MLIFIYLTVLLSTVNCFFQYDPDDDVFRDEPPELPEENRRMIVPDWWSELTRNKDNFDDSDRYGEGVDGDGDDDDDDLDPVDLYLNNVINSYPKARDMFDTLRLNDEVNDPEERTSSGKGKKGHGVTKSSGNRHRDSEILEKNESVKGDKRNKVVISNESPSMLMDLDRLPTTTLGPQGVHIFTGESEDDEDDDNDDDDDDDEDEKPMTWTKNKEKMYFDNPMYKWWSHAYERPKSGRKQTSTTQPSSTKTDKVNVEKIINKEMSFDDEDDDDDDDGDDEDGNVSSSSTTETPINSSTQATTVRPRSSSKTSTSTTTTATTTTKTTTTTTTATTTAPTTATTTATPKSASITTSPSDQGKNKTTSSSKKHSKSHKLKTTPSMKTESVVESSRNGNSNSDLSSSESTLTTVEPASPLASAGGKNTTGVDSDVKEDQEEDPVEIFLNSLYRESDRLTDRQHNISTTISSQLQPGTVSQRKHSKHKKTSTSPPTLTTTDSVEQLPSTPISNKKSTRKHKKNKNSTLSAALSDDDFPTISVTRSTTPYQSDLQNSSTTSTPSGLTIDNTESTTLTPSSLTTTPIPTLRPYADDEFNEDDSDLYEETVRPLWNPDLFP